jgi:hypothetical protein
MTTAPTNLPEKLTGYHSTDDYLAQQTMQGKRINYLISLPIFRVLEVLPIPDPGKSFEDNRVVDAKRAKKFAAYVHKNENWSAGVLQVRSDSSTCDFSVTNDYEILKFGTLKVPAGNRGNFRILDGQHRILGFKFLLDDLSEALTESKRQLQSAISAGNPSSEIKKRTKVVDDLKIQLNRFFVESIGVQIVIEGNPDLARDIFVDINDNAKGVNKSVTSRFDSSKVANRAMQLLLTREPVHSLIENRVDEQIDRVTGSNVNLLSAGKLADLIRFSYKGIYGRFSDDMDSDHSLDVVLAAHGTRFLDVLLESSPHLQKVVSGKMTTGELRESNMIGSITMLSVLAGVFRNLSEDGVTDQSISTFFSRLNSHMTVPISSATDSGKIWLSVGKEEAFVEGANAPGARAQQVKELVTEITGWHKNPPNNF